MLTIVTAVLGRRPPQKLLGDFAVMVMEKKMETTGIIRVLHRDNGQENGNNRDYRGLYRENGKENGNYRDYEGFI